MSRGPSTVGADEKVLSERESCVSGYGTSQQQAQRDSYPRAVTYFSDSERRCGQRRPMPPPIYTTVVPRTKPISQDPLHRLVARGGFADSRQRCGQQRPMPVSLGSC